MQFCDLIYNEYHYKCHLFKASTVSPPKEDSEITKIIDLHIEDFQELLQPESEEGDFIKTSGFNIGGQPVSASFYYDKSSLSVLVDIYPVVVEPWIGGLKFTSIHVTGYFGKKKIDKKKDFPGGIEANDGWFSSELGSVAELKEAMTTSGNYKLDLQVAFTALIFDSDLWIMTR